MTSPIDNLDLSGIMPYSIRYKMSTGVYMVPEPGQKATGYSYALPAGVHQLQLSFTGEEAAEIWWRPAGAGTKALRICPIPADTTGMPRSSIIATVQASGTGRIEIVTTSRPDDGTATASTASVQVYPLPA